MKTNFLLKMSLVIKHLEDAIAEMESLHRSVESGDDVDGTWSGTEEYLRYEIEDLKRLLRKYIQMVDLA